MSENDGSARKVMCGAVQIKIQCGGSKESFPTSSKTDCCLFTIMYADFVEATR